MGAFGHRNIYAFRSLTVLGWVMLAGFIAALSTAARAAEQSDPSIDARVEVVLTQLTIEQKVAQVIQGEIKDLSPAQVARHGIGSVLNGGGSFPGSRKSASVNDWLDLATQYWDAALVLDDGTRLPPIWGTDAVHGHNNVMGATLFPHNIGLGATGDEALIEEIAAATAREVKATGIDWVFAPTVAVAQDYRWGRTYESYAADPDLVSRFGAAAVRGFQREGVATTAKHFIGDGGTTAGVDQGDVRGPIDVLRDPHARAYTGVLAEQVPTVMASFNSWNGYKVHGERDVLTNLLRGELGFSGMVVSDWNGIGQVGGCTNASCARAFNAGIDMIMAPQDWAQLKRNMLRQLQDGTISMARLDEAVARVLRVKLSLGLDRQPAPNVRIGEAERAWVGHADHRAIARDAVRRSLVLLKNNGQVLPLSARSKIAVIGSGADDIAMQSGGWTLTWQGTGNTNADFPGATSIRDGFSERVTPRGGEIVTSLSDSPDVAVVVFGERPYAEGQGDLETLAFDPADDADYRLMSEAKAQGIPVVAVFLTGRPLWVNQALNQADAFVVAWLPGSEGAGISDVLVAGTDSGDEHYDFRGRLPFPWPAVDINALDDVLPVDEHLWPAGYGLDYSMTVSVPELNEASRVQRVESDVVIFRRGVQSPWGAYTGDEMNWVAPVSGADVTTALGELRVTNADVRVQEDARDIAWMGNGRRDSQFYFKTTNDTTRDLSHLQEGALSVVLQVLESPKGDAKLRMDCQWPCRGELNVTRLLRLIPEKQWVRLSFPMSCFADAGVNLEKVNAPFVMISNREMGLRVLDIAAVAEPDPDSLVPCG